MRIKARRGVRRAGWLALLLVVVLPELASAQANALFPDLYIKRKRECCAHEDPRYSAIREQYYGYFPTCWRRFPPGWGCPSPDAPNWEEALRKLPLEMPQAPGGMEEPTDPFTDPGALPEGALPELPREDGSLFPGTPARPAPDVPPGQPTPRTDAPDPFTPGGAGPAANVEESDPSVPALDGVAEGDEAGTAPPMVPPVPVAMDPHAPPAPLASSGGMIPEAGMRPVEARRGFVSQLLGRIRRR
jgi:hypothetical protein